MYMLAKYWSPLSVDVDGTVRISGSGKEKADVGHYKGVRVGAELMTGLQGPSDREIKARAKKKVVAAIVTSVEFAGEPESIRAVRRTALNR